MSAFTKASPQVTTTYTVVVTDSRGCIDSDSVVVVVAPPPVPVKASPGDTLLCKGAQVKLRASGAVVYQWWPLEDLDNPKSPTPIATVNGDRQYVVTGRDSSGCHTTDTVRITQAAGPEVHASSEGIGSYCKQIPVKLAGTGNAVSYRWLPPTYVVNSSNAYTTARPPITTVYTLEATGANGCKSTDTVTAFVSDESVVVMPNAFSPNGDGINDAIRPLIYCDFTLDEYRIYNRWGELVFTANDVSTAWKGFQGGSAADIGSYHYVIIGKRPSKNEKALYKGNFLLLR
jgi:gliding motility-associated-like protein